MTAIASQKFITLGHPSYVWRRGQERRLDLIRQHVPLEGRRILDVGCGIGTYVAKFREFSEDVYGVDIDEDKVTIASRRLKNIFHAPAEKLPFDDNSFDVVMLHEVIEHVKNDRESIREATRCVRPGGRVVIFAPNRLYPFETHGFFIGKKFVFRLLPLINYTPDFFRNIFCHHVRIYTQRGIKRLFEGQQVSFEVCTHIYPGFDNVAERNPAIGQFLQHATTFAEATMLRAFGISHFIVARKLPTA
jgi:ubiquinone/menaquinone biosynthesis C-methylase UbiE